MTRLTKEAFKELIDGDINWVAQYPSSVERSHIIEILKISVDLLYPEKSCTTPIYGIEEGNVCNRNGCKGVIVYTKSENCSCHISPPCNSCMSVKLYCPICGWEAKHE